MAYRVIVRFTDLQDSGHIYGVGDEYPRAGLIVTDERIAELASAANRRGVPLIAKEVKRGRPKKDK